MIMILRDEANRHRSFLLLRGDSSIFSHVKTTWMRPLLIAAACTFFILPVVKTNANTFIESSAVPGGIARIELDAKRFPVDGPAPELFWKKKPIAVVRSAAGYSALVGIPLSTKPGDHLLSVKGSSANGPAISFSVSGKQYAEQRLVIKNTRKVNPAPLDMKRINKENERLKVIKTIRTDRLIADDFKWPLAGIMSSPFGLKRFYNDQARRPHGGIDIAAAEGTPIIAPADGVVIDTNSNNSKSNN